MFDLSAFDDSIFPEFDNFLLSEKSFEQVKKGKFGTTIYVENSLSATSVVMANMRISPVQITCYGHPVSSGGTQMDYYIGGAEVECDVKKQPQQHYNERLVIIPGLASSPVKPTYELQNFTDKNDFTVVTCSWGKIKSNYPMIKNLQTIRDKSKTKFKFLFNGIEGTNFSYLTFTNDLVDLLGADSVVAMHQLPNEDYMYNLERSDMGVDAFPFGGYTRVIDYVWVRRPVVVLEGQRAFNRQGSAVLRRLGLDELIARNEDEYIKKSIKLIDDAGYREELTTKMKKLDLDKLLFNNANNAYFAKAVSYIIQNHKNLQKQKSKTPVFVN
jgi:predicted O-linked N-acetylglucosamine transferase (SPINDLY family)